MKRLSSISRYIPVSCVLALLSLVLVDGVKRFNPLLILVGFSVIATLYLFSVQTNAAKGTRRSNIVRNGLHMVAGVFCVYIAVASHSAEDAFYATMAIILLAMNCLIDVGINQRPITANATALYNFWSLLRSDEHLRLRMTNDTILGLIANTATQQTSASLPLGKSASNQEVTWYNLRTEVEHIIYDGYVVGLGTIAVKQKSIPPARLPSYTHALRAWREFETEHTKRLPADVRQTFWTIQQHTQRHLERKQATMSASWLQRNNLRADEAKWRAIGYRMALFEHKYRSKSMQRTVDKQLASIETANLHFLQAIHNLKLPMYLAGPAGLAILLDSAELKPLQDVPLRFICRNEDLPRIVGEIGKHGYRIQANDKPSTSYTIQTPDDPLEANLIGCAYNPETDLYFEGDGRANPATWHWGWRDAMKPVHHTVQGVSIQTVPASLYIQTQLHKWQVAGYYKHPKDIDHMTRLSERYYPNRSLEHDELFSYIFDLPPESPFVKKS